MRTSNAVVVGKKGIVASPHYLASAVGLGVLREGGNAVDAAVAMSATLHVTVPEQCATGGDNLWMIYAATEGRLYGLNASGRAPRGLSAGLVREQGLTQMPVRGGLPVTVPGSVDGWCTALRAFGSMPLARLLQPAIDHAEQGVPIGTSLAAALLQAAPELQHLEGWRQVFMPDGTVPKAGDLLRQPELAQTLRTIAAGGRDAFYLGEMAKQIVRSVQREGGVLTVADLAAHRSEWVSPLSVPYRGYTIYEMPPNSRGLISLMALRLLEAWDLGSMTFDSPLAVHLMIRAYRLARDAFDCVAGDPAFVPISAESMLSEAFLADLGEKMGVEGAATPLAPVTELPGDTVAVAVVDGDGNAVSLIDSTYYTFGSGIVVDGCGLTLQNRGSYFSLDREHPNCLEAGKRPIHTLMPAMAFRDGRPWLVYGAMGGDGQAQTHLQLLHRIVDLGMDVQQAINAPRWVLGGTLVSETINSLRLESRFPQAGHEKLRELGYELTSLGPWSDRVGVAQAIQLDHENGLVCGGADPRGEGLALGW